MLPDAEDPPSTSVFLQKMTVDASVHMIEDESDADPSGTIQVPLGTPVAVVRAARSRRHRPKASLERQMQDVLRDLREVYTLKRSINLLESPKRVAASPPKRRTNLLAALQQPLHIVSHDSNLSGADPRQPQAQHLRPAGSKSPNSRQARASSALAAGVSITSMNTIPSLLSSPLNSMDSLPLSELWTTMLDCLDEPTAAAPNPGPYAWCLISCFGFYFRFYCVIFSLLCSVMVHLSSLRGGEHDRASTFEPAPSHPPHCRQHSALSSLRQHSPAFDFLTCCFRTHCLRS